jgi:hypothetical protein
MIHYLLQKKHHSASLITYEKEVVSHSIRGRKALWAKAMAKGKFLVKKDFFAFLFLVLAAAKLPQGIVFFAALGTSAVAVVLSVLTLKKRRASRPAAVEQISEAAQ